MGARWNISSKKKGYLGTENRSGVAESAILVGTRGEIEASGEGFKKKRGSMKENDLEKWPDRDHWVTLAGGKQKRFGKKQKGKENHNFSWRKKKRKNGRKQKPLARGGKQRKEVDMEI